MKSFRFQQFEIQQCADVFRVGTDGVLLGAMASVEKAKNILEVGAGTGLISLMIAQRNPTAKIMAVDISEKAIQLSSENFKKSPYSERLSVVWCDFKNLYTDKRFDLIISNPPYFEPNSSLKDVCARQKIDLDFSSLISKSATLLAPGGIFSIIIPAGDEKRIVQKSKERELKLFRKINIFGIEGGLVKRNILEFSKELLPFSETNFIVEKSPRKYSDSYLELTKEFHVFKE